MDRETNQGAIAIEFDGVLFPDQFSRIARSMATRSGYAR